MKKTLPLLCITLLLSFCSQEKKLLRQAANAVDRSDFEKALTYYDQLIQKDDKSFHGNAGKGIVLSEFLARHEQAIPYLEKALANSPDKSKPIIHGDLGKSYHFIGNYKRALMYYGKLDNDPKYNDYDEFLTKRIADCKYAIEHPAIATEENQNLKNVGNTINTDKPEYTPVVSKGVMFFTSKRQDDPKEKKNGIDGKFFESVYTSTMTSGTWSAPKKFDLPKGMQMRKYGEAVASITPDGQKLFIYKAGKIYETDINNTDHMQQLDKTINSAGLMNHAALSPDGKTMFFTSESSKGNGGSDIYWTSKKDDGSWEEPRALDYSVNTSYDEEAPFITADGVLYFASNGHPGYGGFDIYKTQRVNGAWTKPENLGQPINSPGDDIFFTLLNGTSNGYYASARPGGFGDLDIYHVHYLRTENVECKPTDMMSIVATPDLNNPLQYNVQLQLADNIKNTVRSYRWSLDGQALAHTNDNFQHTFNKPGDYKFSAKIISYCDTCPTLNAYCAEKAVNIQTNILAKQDSIEKSKTKAGRDALAANNKKNKKDKQGNNVGGQDTENGDNDALASNDNTGKSGKGKKKGKGTSGTGTDGTDGTANNNSTASNNNSGTNTSSSSDNNNASGNDDYKSLSGGFLSDDKLKELNWNTSAVLFDYNASDLRGDAKSILDQNIGILKNKDNLTIVISGYADSRGTEEYNKQLSAKRAKSVKDYLLSNGVNNKQIKGVKALGESQLVNSCTDAAPCDDSQHQQNRRVKLDVISSSRATVTRK